MSEALNVVVASFGAQREVTTAPLWQWDKGQILKIVGLNLPSTFEIHYSNSKARGTAKQWIGYDGEVEILDEYLTSGVDVWGFIYLHEGEDDGETEYVIHIPVRERPEVEDVEPTPSEQNIISETIAALNKAVDESETNVEHYPCIIDGYWNVWDAQTEQFVNTGISASPTDEQIDEAVDTWLDDHPEATTTVDFSIATKVFNTVSAMIADTSLEVGDNVCTKGYYASGDGGGDNFVIASTHKGVFYVTLANGLYANRIAENKFIAVNKIGVKSYSKEADALEDTASMATNKTITQLAIDSGFSLVFGNGYYAFSDYLQMDVGVNIEGISRELTRLLFPNSIGFNFNRHIEYHYQYFRELRIKSLGNCINVDATVYNVINCRFHRLWLTSEEGECIVAPPNNNGARGTGDTCVWSCVFSHIHGESKTGAVFANIKGLGNWFYFLMILGDTKIAFRNCSGTVARLDTAMNDAQYCFYYDDVQDYALALTLYDVHFEACSKAFIYTEDETMSTMAISVFAVDSGITRPQMVNSDIPFIKVGALLSLYHYGKYDMLPSESYFDMEALHGAIIHTNGFVRTQFEKFKTNMGGTSGLKVWARTQLYTFYGDYNNVRFNNPYENRPVYEAIGVNRLFGGRSHQQLTITDDMLPENTQVINLKSINPSYEFCDSVVFELTDGDEPVSLKRIATGDTIPGKIFTIMNKATSTKNIVLMHGIDQDNTPYCLVANENLVLVPGKSVTLYLDYYQHLNGTEQTIRWFVLPKEYALPDATATTKGGVMIESIPTLNSTKAITSGGVYAALTGLHNINFHICTSGEYDAVTGVPTVQNPDEYTFYLVPNGEQTGSDLFVEWIYRNSAWELVGSAQIDLSNYVQKTDIASAPARGNINPVSSGGVYTALTSKQNTLTFDNVPTDSSDNPVTSDGIKTAIDAAVTALSAQVVKIDANGYFYVE